MTLSRFSIAVTLMSCVCLCLVCSCQQKRPTFASPEDEAPNEFILYLNADGSVSETEGSANVLSEKTLQDRLQRAMDDYLFGGADSERVVIADIPVELWRRSRGPLLTIAADPRATHGELDELLRKCTDNGFEQFALRRSGDGLIIPFVLFADDGPDGIPEPNQLPPMILHMKANEEGQLNHLRLNERPFRGFSELTTYIDKILGDERGPRSIQAAAELEMHCDPGLHGEYVFEALEAVTRYTTKEGAQVWLVMHVRPVTWGRGKLELIPEIEEFEEEFEGYEGHLHRNTEPGLDPEIKLMQVPD